MIIKINCLLEVTDKENGSRWHWHRLPKSWIHVSEIYRPHVWKHSNGLLPHFGSYGHNLPTGYAKFPNGSKLKIITVDPDSAKRAHLHIHKVFKLFPACIEVES